MSRSFYYREGGPVVHNRVRYFKLTMSFLKEGDPNAFQQTEPTFDRHLFKNVVQLKPNAPRLSYKPVGTCIYCGATEYTPGSSEPLAEEHIVPEGLGARLVLPAASCRSCEAKTSNFERANLRHLFWVPRQKLNLRGKKRKRELRPHSLPIIKPDGSEMQITLALEDHPALLVLPILHLPGIWLNRPSGVNSAWAYGLGRGCR